MKRHSLWDSIYAPVAGFVIIALVAYYLVFVILVRENKWRDVRYAHQRNVVMVSLHAVYHPHVPLSMHICIHVYMSEYSCFYFFFFFLFFFLYPLCSVM